MSTAPAPETPKRGRPRKPPAQKSGPPAGFRVNRSADGTTWHGLHVAPALAAARRRAGMSLDDVARATGYTVSARLVGHYEAQVEPRWGVLLVLCAALKIEPSALIPKGLARLIAKGKAGDVAGIVFPAAAEK